MGLWLKQSTAIDLVVGPFIDKTDGNTAETALTVTQAEVRLSKNGGNMAQKNEATALAHDELGYYVCKLDTTDTNTLGILQLMIHESADALPVYHEYMVVTANVWDTLCSTDLLQTDLTQIGGVAQSATDLKDFADAGYDPATDKVTGVKLCDQTTLVDTTTTNTDLVTAAAVNTAVEAGDLALVLADTNEVQASLANGGFTDLIIDAIKAKTDNLPADPADDSDIDAQLATIAGYLDTEIAAIKAVTDTLTLGAIADAVHDEVVDANNPANANSFREVINVMSAALAGKSSGGGTATIKFRDLGDTKDRVTATVTADGNRTAVTNDGT